MPAYNLVRLLGHLTYLYTGRIQMLGKTPGASSPHKNMEKKVHTTVMFATLNFQGTAQCVDFNLLHFYLWGHLKAPNFLTSCKVYWLAYQEGLCSME
jgi:hypothetical protein